MFYHERLKTILLSTGFFEQLDHNKRCIQSNFKKLKHAKLTAVGDNEWWRE